MRQLLFAVTLAFVCLILKSVAVADYPDLGFVIFFPHLENKKSLIEDNVVLDAKNNREKMQFKILGEKSDFSGLDLRDAKIHLELGELHQVNFNNANLERADLRETVYVGCSFRGANLRYANLSDGITPSCDFTDADITGAICRLTQKQIQSTYNFKNKDFSNIHFIDVNFSGMDFSGKFIFNGTSFFVPDDGYLACQFDGCNIEDADLRILPHYFCKTAKQIFLTKNFKDKDLTGIELSNIDFSGCDFTGFILGGFVNCRFENAKFTDAEFADPKLINSRNFIEGHGNRVGFINASVTKEQFEQTATWKKKNFRGLFFEGINLDHWDFSNTCLRETSFRNSSVKGTLFRDAVISVNSGAVVINHRTDFTGTKNLSDEQKLMMRTIFE